MGGRRSQRGRQAPAALLQADRSGSNRSLARIGGASNFSRSSGMELIISVVATLCAFLGAVAAHFVAHDAYSRCPRYAQRLIELAARHLPEEERERYQEEWLADLHEFD